MEFKTPSPDGFKKKPPASGRGLAETLTGFIILPSGYSVLWTRWLQKVISLSG